MHEEPISDEIKKELKLHPVIGQFSRFVIVGLINTGIDYAILFLLSHLTGITSGNGIIPLNVISFSIATTNSYLLNKRWSFHDRTEGDHGRKLSMFLLVSLVGVIINTTVVRLLTSNGHLLVGIDETLRLLIAKVAATGLSLIWNFLGYKAFVFKK